jgi:hypothetical protein
MAKFFSIVSQKIIAIATMPFSPNNFSVIALDLYIIWPDWGNAISGILMTRLCLLPLVGGPLNK